MKNLESLQQEKVMPKSLDQLKSDNDKDSKTLEGENLKLKNQVKALERKVKVTNYINEQEYPPEVVAFFDFSSDEKIESVKNALESIFSVSSSSREMLKSSGFNYFLRKIKSMEYSSVRIITDYDELHILEKIINYLQVNPEVKKDIFGNDYKKEVDVLSDAFFNPKHTKNSKNNCEKVTYIL